MPKRTEPGPTDRRYYISVETDFFDHPKTLAIGRELAFAVLASLAYCHKQLTDGVLPEQAAKQILPHKRDRDRLVKHGWWDEARGGNYLVHDYLKHQPSRVQMRRKSDAGRNAAGIRWSVRANAEQHAGEGGEGPEGDANSNAERHAKGITNRNAERNASGNAKGNAESMQSQSYTQKQTDLVSVAIATVPPAREDDEPEIPSAPDARQDAARSGSQARREGMHAIASTVQKAARQAGAR